MPALKPEGHLEIPQHNYINGLKSLPKLRSITLLSTVFTIPRDGSLGTNGERHEMSTVALTREYGILDRSCELAEQRQ